MHTVFFNYLLGTEKLATVITDKSPKELIEEGVIPKGAAWLIAPVPTKEMTEEESIIYREIEYTRFDDYKNPKEVLVDYPAIMFSLIEEMRDRRNQLLEVLDLLQQRAFIKGKTGLVEEIEEDKQKLRDCLDIDVLKYTCLDSFKNYIPDILAIDYKVKYEPKLYA